MWPNKDAMPVHIRQPLPALPQAQSCQHAALGAGHQHPFENLQTRGIAKRTPSWPDFSSPFTITPDSSKFAVGGVLEQKKDDGIHPVAGGRGMVPVVVFTAVCGDTAVVRWTNGTGSPPL
eukprot:CAMPEP_0114277788 /NCGR_PEP_ID=MMETSP0059-20121206/987_1 /TAXON_ID=36894 /ORGANISM="Pyramimonas parkeae, Strain CCMP726" /LENGTH=119 /DNA_ID=CAMNT_0001397937 /DNA_START=35 /DNA_END=394 /DNA_ORIENTATION=+